MGYGDYIIYDLQSDLEKVCAINILENDYGSNLSFP